MSEKTTDALEYMTEVKQLLDIAAIRILTDDERGRMLQLSERVKSDSILSGKILEALESDSVKVFSEELDYYITENVRNNLPAWDDRRRLPDKQIFHILNNHTLYTLYDKNNDVWAGRFKTRLASMSSNHIDESETETRRVKFMKKYNINNLQMFENILTNKLKSGSVLDRTETAVIDYMIWSDDKDYFPRRMKKEQIIRAIRDAYKGAVKIGSRQRSPSRNRPFEDTNEEGMEGTIKYQGKARDGMVIVFHFHFDEGYIGTAYPKDPEVTEWESRLNEHAELTNELEKNWNNKKK